VPSMGPRSFNRGKVEAIEKDKKEVEDLQWGRGLSTAESSIASRLASVFVCLQWGRGLSTAERRIGWAKRIGLDSPSMGPRSFNRGKSPFTPRNRRTP